MGRRTAGDEVGGVMPNPGLEEIDKVNRKNRFGQEWFLHIWTRRQTAIAARKHFIAGERT
jgi:hypothetical protein